MDYKENWNYIFSLKLPDGYQIDDLPKSVIVKLNTAGDMNFSNILNFDTATKTFNLKSSFTTKRSYFSATDYPNIRNLFVKILEEEGKKIILKME